MLLYLEVGDEPPALDQPRPRHDVAGPSLNVDLFIAEVGPGGEAGLGGADVAAHGGPMEP